MPRKPADTSTTETDPVAAARAEVARLGAAEYGLAILYRQRAVELAGVRAERGDEILAAKDPAGAAREAGRRGNAMTEELAGLADAADRARERRLASIPLVYAAEADEAERAAASLESEADELAAESGRLRAALEAFDDCSYSPTPPALTEGARGGQQGGTFTVVVVRVPRFERLRIAAREKRNEATQARLKTPPAAGAVEADDLDDLLEQIYADPLRVGPPIAAIAEWAGSAASKERRRRERSHSGADGFVPADAPMRLHLVWNAGVIDQGTSGVLRSEEIAQADPYLGRHVAQQVVPEEIGGSELVGSGRRPSSTRSPYTTGPTKEEIEREAAATGKSIEQVAEEFGYLDAAAELVDVDAEAEVPA